MAHNPKSFAWILFHSAAIVAVLISLFTGLRIASLSKPYIAGIAEFLPQGQMHGVHFFSACVLSVIALGYLIHRSRVILREGLHNFFRGLCAFGYHRTVIWLGCIFLLSMVVSGWLLFFGYQNLALVRGLHFYFALGLASYILLHGGVYFVQLGKPIVLHILRPAARVNVITMTLVGGTLVAVFMGWQWISTAALHQLSVAPIAPEVAIDIDGEANEVAWQNAQTLIVETDGGANFYDGRTQVKLRALRNQQEVYFHIRWQDPSESLVHLPLEKTEAGWIIRQNGFHNFNEVDYYEDKFAILLSNSCDFGAAGTSHLGRKPLAEKPGNWHGKGYHYSDTEQIHDLWHWKAVRTNDMYLADDNFIGKPDIVRSGSRRYTAGYQQDGKESGAYVMNWFWYKPGIITPKRIPAEPQVLDQFRAASTSTRAQWVIPWFDYQPYQKINDRFPAGTRMPSVIYNSNRFEGDRADVRAHGVWRDGFWSLELVRKLDTGSPLDVPVNDGVCLWVSAFDRAQIAHTRHAQAIQLVME